MHKDGVSAENVPQRGRLEDEFSLVVEGVSKNDTAEGSLQDASLSVHRGETVTLVGPRPSTASLFRSVAGFEDPETGTIAVGDQSLEPLTPTEVAEFRRRRIGLIYPILNLVPTLSVAENIEFTARANNVEVPEGLVDELLALSGLSDKRDDSADTLTPTEAQIVACARAFALRPFIVIALDPTQSLDYDGTRSVLSFLSAAGTALKQAMLLLTEEEEVASLSGRTLFVDEGKIVGLIVPPAPSAQLGQLSEDEVEQRDREPSVQESLALEQLQEQLRGLTLAEIMEEIAPGRQLTEKQKIVLEQAQNILNSLPGPVIDLES